jgi:hypothetical protein
VVRLTPADMSGLSLSILGVHHDVAARVACANLAHADSLVGIYMDAGTSSCNAGSITLYDAARPFAAANQHLATLLATRRPLGDERPGMADPRRRRRA